MGWKERGPGSDKHNSVQASHEQGLGEVAGYKQNIDCRATPLCHEAEARQVLGNQRPRSLLPAPTATAPVPCRHPQFVVSPRVDPTPGPVAYLPSALYK